MIEEESRSLCGRKQWPEEEGNDTGEALLNRDVRASAMALQVTRLEKEKNIKLMA